MADSTAGAKRLSIGLPPELVAREKQLRATAKNLDVPFELTKEYASVISKVLDKFEMNELAAAGHPLSEELQKKKSAKQAGVIAAKQSRENNRPDYLDARSDNRSLHSIIHMNDQTPDTIKIWNKQSRELATVLKALKVEFKKRKLQQGIDDICIATGWAEYQQFAERVFIE